MRITTRLILISSCVAATLLVLLPVLVWSFLEFEEAKSNYLLADQIQDNFQERASFRNQYFLYREEHMKVLWEQNKETADHLLRRAEATFRRASDREQLQLLRVHIEDNAAIFRRIVANSANLRAPGEGRQIYEELDKRLSSQLLLKAAAVHDAAMALQDACEQRVELTYHRLAVIVSIFAFSLALATLLASLQILRLIRRRLASLHSGIRTIAKGHLGFRLQLEGSDEFSDLGRSVDSMAERLESSTRQLGEEVAKGLLLAAQQESEARFHTWFNLPLIGICITSPAKGWLEVNDRLCGMLGYGREELTKLTWAELTHPGDLATDQDQFGRVLRGEIDGYSLEKRFLHKDGRALHTELAVRCVRRADGSVDYFVALLQDISERKLAEAALLESEKRYRMLFEQLTEGFALEEVICDETGKPWDLRFLDMNPAFEKQTGLKNSEVVGRTLRELFPGVEPLWIDRYGKVALTGEPAQFEAEFGALQRTYEVRAFQAAPGRVGVTFTDISDRKQAEEEKAKFLAQLTQAQKMESLGNLAGGVAHDMNNVLGAILGLASANIEAQPTGSKTQQAFETIIKAALRGGKMVQGLLSFARHKPVEELEVDVNAVLQDEVRLLERTTLARVRFHIDLEPNLRAIRGDSSALSNAFMNLCVNAVDSMPETGTLTLQTRNVDNAWIEVVVEDNGMGMPREVLEKAMDPFFTTKETGKGTGLGLSMVFSTVKAHRGQMAIESEPGRGTRVMLRFPACENEAPVQVAEPAVAVATLTPEGTLKVLLVDDDELIQSSIQAILEVLGYTVNPAQSGEEALAKLEAGFEPDLVILDMNMPGLGGIGTLPRLRGLRPEVPVLLATGRVDQTALTLASAHPGVHLLPKPFGLRELQKQLENFGLG